jgi:hypothetical protein
MKLPRRQLRRDHAQPGRLAARLTGPPIHGVVYSDHPAPPLSLASRDDSRLKPVFNTALI